MQTLEPRTGMAANGWDAWRAGLAAGLLAALAMMAFLIGAGILDPASDALDPLRAVGTSLRGSEASAAGAVPVVWGIVLHLVVGAILGMAFTAIVPRDMTGAAASVLGGGCALILMAFALTVLVPRFAPGLHARMPAQGGAWVIAHALFGAVLGVGPTLRRRMAGRPARRAPDAGPGALRPRTAER